MAKVLLCDESPADRAIARKTLLAAGHEVVEAATADAARAGLADADIEIVVIDSGLPDAPGDDALELVRAIAVHAITPIVMTLSADPPPASKRRRRFRHEQPVERSPLIQVAVERLAKPFAPHQLVEAVTRAVRLRAEMAASAGDVQERIQAFDDWTNLQQDARHRLGRG